MSGIMIYCGQRATEPNALSKGTQPVLETGGFGHDAVNARGVFSPQPKQRDVHFREIQ